MQTILLTGASGVVGRYLFTTLTDLGYKVRPFDIKLCSQHVHSMNACKKQTIRCADRNQERICYRGESIEQNILDQQSLTQAMVGCHGVIHLAAVSRVAWGQQDPISCWQTNVRGTQNVLQQATVQKERPWIIFASSREVYGQPPVLPVDENSPLSPMNIYGQSKAAAEQAMWEAREAGLQVAVLRLTNIYGASIDYPDRVMPALTIRALQGETLHITGGHRTFDFIHISDVLRGILATVHLLEAGEKNLPPIHLLSGYPITLHQLAQTINKASGERSEICKVPRQNFDVTHFYGDPSRAQQWLGWRPQVSLHDGLVQFIEKMRHKVLRSPINDSTLPQEQI